MAISSGESKVASVGSAVGGGSVGASVGGTWVGTGVGSAPQAARSKAKIKRNNTRGFRHEPAGRGPMRPPYFLSHP